MFDHSSKTTEQKTDTTQAQPAAEESSSHTSFTSHGAIPPVSAATQSTASAPTASDQAFGDAQQQDSSWFHRSKAPTPTELAELSADQRADYDRIIAANATSPHPIDPAVAFKNAKSGRPLTDADRAAIADVQAKMASLKVTSIDTHDPNQVQMEISFDGTWNDRDEMAFQTNPALLNEMFDGPAENKIYEVGVGTSESTKVLGGATGFGIHERIKDAYKKLVARINEVKATNPKANVVLIVSGFSRGATAARAFTNELNKLGVPDLGSKLPDGSYGHMYETPKIGAMMLFDTVGSVGLAGDSSNRNLDGSELDLSIPKNAQNVLQLTARDEKRRAFPLSSAVDPAHADPRINEFALPGVHSDIGGGYPNPYSQVSLQLGTEYLQKVGVQMKPNAAPPVSASDPANRLHESRSGLELLVGGDHEQRKVFPGKNPQ